VPDRAPFLLDPDVVFLNHGSFGAVPGTVFDAYQHLQLEMERQPVAWLQRGAEALLAGARTRLAEYVGCAADELAYFPNPTTAINMVAKSLVLEPGDEILTTDHEYGAMDRTWKVICAATGAHYVRAHIPFAITADDVVERVWAECSGRTKVLFLSHMTSATAMRFPVDELVRRAREAGILTIIDGAHIPGHVPLDLAALGADIYTGANHKWMCAPKGSAFLYARREVQHLLHPLVVSWGWESDHPSGSQFIDHHEWQGTRDLAPFLATPVAIDWIATQDWPAVQARCHAMLRGALERIDALTGRPSAYADDGFDWFAQLAVVRLPELDPVSLKQRLYDEFRVETPVHRFHDEVLLRISIAAYNTDDDVDALVSALGTLLPQLTA
jgi:isopenicillin-N epimerase